MKCAWPGKLTFVLPKVSKDMLPMALCWPVQGDMLLLEAVKDIIQIYFIGLL